MIFRLLIMAITCSSSGEQINKSFPHEEARTFTKSPDDETKFLFFSGDTELDDSGMRDEVTKDGVADESGVRCETRAESSPHRHSRDTSRSGKRTMMMVMRVTLCVSGWKGATGAAGGSDRQQD